MGQSRRIREDDAESFCAITNLVAQVLGPLVYLYESLGQVRREQFLEPFQLMLKTICSI
jgi:hypothetical protein